MKSALLVECGQHWEAGVGDVAKQTVLRFMKHFEVLDAGWLARHIEPVALTPQRVIDITTVITLQSGGFRWIRPLLGLELIREAGTLIAMDGDTEIRTPHADAVMVMPVPRPKTGQTAVRIGLFRPL